MNDEAYNQIETLFRLFRDRGLTELRVEDGDVKLHLCRARRDARPEPNARALSEVTQSLAPRRRTAGGRTVAVRSPLIGVFYRSPAPDAPPFVEIGDTVEKGQTVCIVEAMKVFNEIKAEWRGRVVAVPAEDGSLVQAGEPLLVLEFLDGGRRREER